MRGTCPMSISGKSACFTYRYSGFIFRKNPDMRELAMKNLHIVAMETFQVRHNMDEL